MGARPKKAFYEGVPSESRRVSHDENSFREVIWEHEQGPNMVKKGGQNRARRIIKGGLEGKGTGKRPMKKRYNRVVRGLWGEIGTSVKIWGLRQVKPHKTD